jgi:hypothetical protein
MVACNWLVDVFGFTPVLLEEEEDRILGAVVEHPSGVTLGLHHDPARSGALSGFVVVALATSDIAEWSDYLDRRGQQSSGIERHELGERVIVTGPAGLMIELHTIDQPSEDEA